MKKSIISTLTISFYAVLISSCQPKVEQVETIIIEKNPTEYSTGSVLWQQHSAEYVALCYQAYNIGERRIDEILAENKKTDKPLAVVMDIDETVLDNSSYNATLIANQTSYSKKTWMEWTAIQSADLVPGALEFIQYAKSKGVEVIFISNRMEEELDDTYQNIIDRGVDTISKENFFLKSTTSSKDERRQIVSDKYEVVLLFGDNLGDFNGVFDKATVIERKKNVANFRPLFGDKLIVLPNPMYGEWEGALYNYEFSKTNAQKDSNRMNALNIYSIGK
jgi:5'-nucleotidase (lipoprotein e(P4) family)